MHVTGTRKQLNTWKYATKGIRVEEDSKVTFVF